MATPAEVTTETESDSRAPTRPDRSVIILPIAVVLFVMRVIGPLWRDGMPSFFPDSASFLKVAGIGPFSPHFWFTERPVGLPLVFWLAGLDVRSLVIFQTLAYATSVAFLCATILCVISSRRLAWLTTTVVFAIAIQPRFALWCVEVLSESLGLTTSVIALTLWIRFGARPGSRPLTIATAATAMWALTRDSHGLPLLIIVVILAIGAWRSTDTTLRRTALKCAIALSLTFVYVATSQAVSNRNQYPLMNNVGLRVLPDQSMTDSFIAKGMPTSETLFGRAGRNTWDDGEVFLTSPDLEKFRDWVNGSGQFDQITSLITDAPFWIDVTKRELDGAISYDFGDYDRFDVSDRLPSKVLGFGGLRTTNQLWIATFIAMIGLWSIVRVGRRRLMALILGTGLIATFVEVYASIATDAVEVQRHIVGPLFRLHLLLLVIIVMAIDDRLSHDARSKSRIAHRDTWFPISVASGLALSIIGWFAIEMRSQDFDPQYARTIIERAARFGGTYYENGIHNKGPLETLVYDSVRLFTSYPTYWFGIATYVLLISLVLAIAAAAVNRIWGGNRTSMLLVASVAMVHFSMSSSDYAGVVYSRNLTTAMLALVFILTVSGRFWLHDGRSRKTWVASFLILGLAVQTLLTTLFATLGLVLALMVLRRRETGLRHPILVAMSTFIGAVASAPAWYVLRGRFDEFWSGWWTYASFMSDGTGRGYMEQLGLGWNTIVDYYGERPESLLVILSFGMLAFVRRRSMSPRQGVVTATLATWFVGGWIELILGQRYSSHYFSVIAVPTMLMFASVVATFSEAFTRIGRWSGEPRVPNDPRAVHAPVLAAVAVVLITQCSTLFWDGADRAGNFTSFARLEQTRGSAVDGQNRTIRAILDMVSDDGDAVLAWTMYPWTYLNQERVPATRLSWKSFMVGEIYLGRTSPDYVLPKTWDWFSQDMAESNPAAYLRPKETVLDESTPFATYVHDNFRPVFDGSTMELQLSDSVWANLTKPSSSEMPRSAPFVDESSCFRWRATIVGLNSDEPFGFMFEDLDGSAETVYLSIDATRAWSSSDNVEFASTARSSTRASITLLVGPRSALLIEGDSVLAAVRLEGASRTSLFTSDGVRVSAGTRSTLLDLPGCVNS